MNIKIKEDSIRKITYENHNGELITITIDNNGEIEDIVKDVIEKQPVKQLSEIEMMRDLINKSINFTQKMVNKNELELNDSSTKDNELVITARTKLLMFLESLGCFFDTGSGLDTEESRKKFYKDLIKYLDKINEFKSESIQLNCKLEPNTEKDDFFDKEKMLRDIDSCTNESYYQNVKDIIEKGSVTIKK